MIKTFETYIEDWFCYYLKSHEEDIEFPLTLFNALNLGKGKSITEVLSDKETVLDYLLALNAEDIYAKIFAPGRRDELDMLFPDLPSTYSVLANMLLQAIADEETGELPYAFCLPYIEDMAMRMSYYKHPEKFFKIFNHKYPSDRFPVFKNHKECLNFYFKYADDLEIFRMNLEDRIHEKLSSGNLPYYMWICQICYKELIEEISVKLWE